MTRWWVLCPDWDSNHLVLLRNLHAAYLHADNRNWAEWTAWPLEALL